MTAFGGRGRDWASIAIGAVSLGLGTVVIVGWAIRSRALIQVLPTLVPMQFNTALGFALCGAAMISVGLGRDRLATICGVAAGSIGGLTLAEYVGGVDLHVDQLLMRHYITVETSHPGRMAPNTALCFLMVGLTCSLRRWLSQREARGLVMGLSGATILALGGVALAGYLSGNTSAYGWGEHTRMAVHTAFGFLVLGLGVVAWAYREVRSDESVNRRVLVLVALSTTAIFFADLALPLGVVAGALYILPILISLQTARKQEAFVATVAATVLILVAFFESPRGETPIAIVIGNRLMSIGIVWITAMLGLRMKVAESRLQGINADLERRVEARTADLAFRTIELERTNAVLATLNQQLERSNDDLESFAYVASHDLQEPLRAVAGYVQLLARRYRTKIDADADEFIRYTVEGTERMRELIEELLKYSRVGTRGAEMAPTDMSQVFADVQQGLRATIEESRADVRCTHLPTIPADATQMRQLLQNLMANAIKFRGEDVPRIRIDAEETNEGWRFRVQDNGMGLETQYAERIFKIFQRLNRREDYFGTGIGLAVCRKIVHRHGGEIGVDSTLGQGATFWFTVPRMIGKQEGYDEREYDREADSNLVGGGQRGRRPADAGSTQGG